MGRRKSPVVKLEPHYAMEGYGVLLDRTVCAAFTAWFLKRWPSGEVAIAELYRSIEQPRWLTWFALEITPHDHPAWIDLHGLDCEARDAGCSFMTRTADMADSGLARAVKKVLPVEFIEHLVELRMQQIKESRHG